MPAIPSLTTALLLFGSVVIGQPVTTVRPDAEKSNLPTDVKNRIPEERLRQSINEVKGVPGLTHAEYGCDTGAKVLGDDDIWRYAKAWYEILDKERVLNRDVLVAVIYVPQQGICFGSKPYATPGQVDAFLPLIEPDIKEHAPEIWEFYQERRTNAEAKLEMDPKAKVAKNDLSRIHAEDYAYAMTKKELKMKADARFPPGTKGAVWGLVDPRRPLGPQNNCKMRTRVDPPCAQIQTALGIEYLDASTSPLDDSAPSKIEQSHAKSEQTHGKPEQIPAKSSASEPARQAQPSGEGAGTQPALDPTSKPKRPSAVIAGNSEAALKDGIPKRPATSSTAVKPATGDQKAESGKHSSAAPRGGKAKDPTSLAVTDKKTTLTGPAQHAKDNHRPPYGDRMPSDLAKGLRR